MLHPRRSSAHQGPKRRGRLTWPWQPWPAAVGRLTPRAGSVRQISPATAAPSTKYLDHSSSSFGSFHQSMNDRRLAKLTPKPVRRIKRGGCTLRNVGDAISSQACTCGPRHQADIAALKRDPAFRYLTARPRIAQSGKAYRRFSSPDSPIRPNTSARRSDRLMPLTIGFPP